MLGDEDPWPGRTGGLPSADHPIRQSILAQVERAPGINLESLCRAVKANRGTITYHLNVLDEAGLIVSVHTGNERRLFCHDQVDDIEVLRVLLRGRAQELALLVASRPGVMQKTLSIRLSMSRKSLRAHMDRLVAHELIEEAAHGKTRRYHPTPQLIGLLKWLARSGSAGVRSRPGTPPGDDA